MRKILILLVFVMLFVVGSCGEDLRIIVQKPEGSEGGLCYGNKTCNNGLVCVDGVCVDLEKATDKDTGNTADGGNTGNSGNTGDTGNSGNTGDTGNSGNTGDTGDTGNTGDAGNDNVKEGMAFVSSGEFKMGCKHDECASHLIPYHAVYLKGYYIDKFEVTAGDFEKCVDDKNCLRYLKLGSDTYVLYQEFFDDPSCHFKDKGAAKKPMNCVSWHAAKAYCEWIGKRLPTEAEWEKAARGTDGRDYPWGDIYIDGNVVSGCSSMCYSKDVGSVVAGVSPYGCYDMSGNVWEWVYDSADENYYKTSPYENPVNDIEDTYRVVRGGASVACNSDAMTTFARRSSNPYASLHCDYGFRCALDE